MIKEHMTLSEEQYTSMSEEDVVELEERLWERREGAQRSQNRADSEDDTLDYAYESGKELGIVAAISELHQILNELNEE